MQENEVYIDNFDLLDLLHPDVQQILESTLLTAYSTTGTPAIVGIDHASSRGIPLPPPPAKQGWVIDTIYYIICSFFVLLTFFFSFFDIHFCAVIISPSSQITCWDIHNLNSHITAVV